MAETDVVTLPTPGSPDLRIDERANAEALARRYHAEFVDLKNFKIQHELLRTVPVELMFRYNFVPIELTPPVRGRGHWVGTRAAVLEPDDRRHLERAGWRTRWSCSAPPVG